MRSVLCLMMLLFIAMPVAMPAIADTEMATSGNSAAQHESSSSANSKVQVQCLSTRDGYLRARLTGSIQAELDWRNQSMNCAGSVRPTGGLRLRFSQPSTSKHPLVLLFGISEIGAGKSGKVLSANVTIMREGKAEFYSTQGDKCTIDELKQTVLPGRPTRKVSYRVEARGFCNQPARALSGDGFVLITRFDFAGRVDVESSEENVSSVVAAAQ
ncbi:MAG TPA: hypothetical protein VHL14_13595 [Steroidobacteraceae bacterium]|jgi:hypothetical protein|nr:hypothetical protein [Steroidobacteraceae bacterium]